MEQERDMDTFVKRKDSFKVPIRHEESGACCCSVRRAYRK